MTSVEKLDLASIEATWPGPQGAKVTHESGAHDDHANAMRGLIWVLTEHAKGESP
jgi:hypothetical protein